MVPEGCIRTPPDPNILSDDLKMFPGEPDVWVLRTGLNKRCSSMRQEELHLTEVLFVKMVLLKLAKTPDQNKDFGSGLHEAVRCCW